MEVAMEEEEVLEEEEEEQLNVNHVNIKIEAQAAQQHEQENVTLLLSSAGATEGEDPDPTDHPMCVISSTFSTSPPISHHDNTDAESMGMSSSPLTASVDAHDNDDPPAAGAADIALMPPPLDPPSKSKRRPGRPFGSASAGSLRWVEMNAFNNLDLEEVADDKNEEGDGVYHGGRALRRRTGESSSINYNDNEALYVLDDDDEGYDNVDAQVGGGEEGDGRTCRRRKYKRKSQIVAEEFWVSCRFCSSTFSELQGIIKVMQHESTNHFQQVELNKKSPFYKIFKLQQMSINVPPTHPFLKRLMERYPLEQNWSLHKKTDINASKVYSGRGRRPFGSYTYQDLLCQYCHQKFKYPSLAQGHSKWCTSRPGYKGRKKRLTGVNAGHYTELDLNCQYCQKRFTYPSMVIQHLKWCASHPDGCGEGIRKHRKRRRRLNYTELDLHCQYCQKRFTYPSMVRQHVGNCAFRPGCIRRPRGHNSKGKGTIGDVEHGSSSSNNCPYCHKTFKFQSMTHAHTRICSLNPNFIGKRLRPLPKNCSYCKRRFKFPSALRQHLRSCKRKPTKANDDDESTLFTNNSTEPTSPASALATKCSYCSQSFKFPSSLWKHLKVCSVAAIAAKPPSAFQSNINRLGDVESEEEEDDDDDESMMLKCELCDHTSLNKQEMTAHRAIIHNITTNTITTTAQQRSSSSRSQTTASTATSSTTPTQPRPRPRSRSRSPSPPRNHHLPPEPNSFGLYSCRFCYRPFPTKYKVLLHERVHTGENPYECHLCQKGFPRHSSWTRHMKMHQGIHWRLNSTTCAPDGEYQCRYCPMKLLNKAGRTIHEKSYHNVVYRNHEDDNVLSGEPIKVMPANKTGVKCRFCYTSCASSTGRQIHERVCRKRLVNAMLLASSRAIDDGGGGGGGKTPSHATLNTPTTNDEVRVGPTRILEEETEEEDVNPNKSMIIVQPVSEFFIDDSHNDDDDDPGGPEVDPLFLEDEEVQVHAQNDEVLTLHFEQPDADKGPKTTLNNAMTMKNPTPSSTTTTTTTAGASSVTSKSNNNSLGSLNNPIPINESEVGSHSNSKVNETASSLAPVLLPVKKPQRFIFRCVKCKSLFQDKAAVASHLCTSSKSSSSSVTTS